MKKKYIAPHIEVIQFAAEDLMVGDKQGLGIHTSTGSEQVLSTEREYGNSSSIWDGMNDE